MAYDQELPDRIRMIIGGDPVLTATLTEKKMFGGLAFLIGGNMAISASGQGGELVRVDPDHSDALVDFTPDEVGVMHGRPMAGWLRVADTDVRTKRQLAKWVGLGTAYAR